MKPKAIFFDVDGTIIPLDVAIKTFQETLKHFNINLPINKNTIRMFIGYRIVQIIPRFIPQVIPFEREFLYHFQETQIKNFKRYSELLPYVSSTFRKIKRRKIKIGIVTTKRRIEAESILKGYRLPYDTLVGNDDVKNIKPNPEPVFKACKNLKVKPKDCIFIGDHAFDMQAAKSAGCIAVGVLTGWGNRKNLECAGADYIIKDLKELTKLIE